MSLAHAEVNTARLLEKVIDAVPDFDLIEIEGTQPSSPQADTWTRRAVAQTLQAAMTMHRAFHLERQYVATNLCPCNGCTPANNLKLKFVAHIGEVATQTIRQRRKLVGIDVSRSTGCSRTPSTVPEYVLFSEEFYRTTDAPLPGPVHEVSQDLEGIGPSGRTSSTSRISRLPRLRCRIRPSADASGGRWPSPPPALPYMLGLRRLLSPLRFRGGWPVQWPIQGNRATSGLDGIVTHTLSGALSVGRLCVCWGSSPIPMTRPSAPAAPSPSTRAPAPRSVWSRSPRAEPARSGTRAWRPGRP